MSNIENMIMFLSMYTTYVIRFTHTCYAINYNNSYIQCIIYTNNELYI